MSQVVDTKVVEMQFDNSKFEKNIETSLNSLKFLNKSIEDAGKGRNSLDELARASDQVGVSFDNMNMKSRISLNMMDMLAGVGTKAFNRISDAVASFAMNMANSLSGMQAMRDGFAEYELKMGSVQTILAGAKIIDPNTGKELKNEADRLAVVNQRLEDLNKYSDRTIYSFKDMTSNIGKFTNAGVNLDDAVDAIQGVANVAAISGANAGEASRAMYNFAQALSSGYVKLIDWKSIENANMATVDFKQQLLDTALALGTVRKEGEMYVTTTTDANGKVSEAFNATKMFNDSLSNQWMTTEVLTTTLKKYTDESTELGKKAFAAATEVKTFSQMMDTLKESLGSGWAQSFEIIFGNFTEAKNLWTRLNDAIDRILSPIGKARNAMLQMWKDNGGRDAMIESFANLYHVVENLLAPIKELWKAFTPNTSNSGKILATIFKWIEKITAAAVKASEKVGKAIAWVLKPAIAAGNWIGEHLIKLVGIIRNSFGKIVKFFEPVGKAIKTFSDGIKEAFGKHIITRIDSVRETFKKTFDNLKKNIGESSVIKKLTEAFSKLKDTLLELFGRAELHAGNFASRFVGYFGRIWKAIQPLFSTAFTSILKALGNFILPKLEKAITWVTKQLNKFANAISKINIKDTKFYKGITELPDKISGLANSKAFKSIKAFGGEAVAFLSDKFEKLKSTLNSISMPKGLSDIFTNVKDFIKRIFGSDSVGEKISGIADTIKDTGSNAIGKAKDLTLFQKFIQGITTALGWLKDGAERALKALKGFVDFVRTNTPKALSAIHNFIAGDDGIITMSDLTDTFYIITDAMSQLSAAFGINKFGDAAKNFSEAFSDIGDALTGLAKSVSMNLKMEAIKSFAIAIALLTGSLFLLSQIPADKLAIATGALLALGYGLNKFFGMISGASADIKSKAGFIPVAAFFISLAAVIIAAAGAMGVLVLALAAFPKVIKSYNKLGNEFAEGMKRVKEVLEEIFSYLDHLVHAKYGFRGALALLGLVASLDWMRKVIVKYASKKTGLAMADGLARIKEVLDLLGDFLKSSSLAALNGINVGINFNALGVAATIFAIGLMLDNISEAMKSFSKFTPTEFQTAIDSLDEVLGSLMTFVGALSFLTSVSNMIGGKVSLGQWLGISATILSVSATISSIVESLKTMTNLAGTDPKAFQTAIDALGGIFRSLDVLFVIIGALKPGKVAAPLFALSLAIGVLTACLVALTPIAANHPEAMKASVNALAELMIALGGALFLAGLASGKTTIGDIVKLIAVTLAMTLLANTIRRLAKTGGSAESITAAGNAIALAVLSMVGAMFALNAISINPATLGALALLAVAIWGVAFAIAAFKSSAGGMAEASDSVSSAGQKMEDQMGVTTEHMAAIAKDAAPQIFDGLFDNIGPRIKKALGDFDLGEALRNAIEKVKADAKNWAQDFIDIGTNLIDGISVAISNPDNVAKVKECCKALAKALVDSFKLFLGIGSPSTVMIEQGGYIIDGLVQGLMDFPGKIAKWVSSIGTAIVDGVSGFFSSAVEKGKGLVDKIGEGIQNGKQAVQKKAQELGKAALSKVAKANEWGKKAVQSANSFGQKLAASKNPIKSSAGKMIVGATNVIHTTQSIFKSSASRAASVFSSQIRSGASPARAAGHAIVAGAKAAFSGISSAFSTYGRNAAQGFRNGINNMISSIANKARELVRAAKNAAKSEQHSNSPSKDFMEYGDWAAQGYAIGLANRKSTKLIEANARKMVNSAKNATAIGNLGIGSLSMNSDPAMRSLAFAMSQISDTLDETLDSSPKIRPVIDMSNVNRNASAISALFGDQSISANMRAVTSAQNGFENSMTRRGEAMSAAAINKLTNRIASMTDTMNSRSLNNYITVDGASDPEAFADDLIRSFRLNARTV